MILTIITLELAAMWQMKVTVNALCCTIMYRFIIIWNSLYTINHVPTWAFCHNSVGEIFSTFKVIQLNISDFLYFQAFSRLQLVKIQEHQICELKFQVYTQIGTVTKMILFTSPLNTKHMHS